MAKTAVERKGRPGALRRHRHLVFLGVFGAEGVPDRIRPRRDDQEEEGDFDYKKKLVAVVKKLTKEEVLKAGREWLLDSDTPRLVLLMRSRDNEETLPEGVISDVSQFKNRRGAQAKRMVPVESGS